MQGPETLEGRATKPLEALVNGQTGKPSASKARSVFNRVIVEPPNHETSPEKVELKATP